MIYNNIIFHNLMLSTSTYGSTCAWVYWTTSSNWYNVVFNNCRLANWLWLVYRTRSDCRHCHNHMRTWDKSSTWLYYDYPKRGQMCWISMTPPALILLQKGLLVCYRSICHQLQTLINVHLVWMCWVLVHVSATTAMDMLWHIQQVGNLLWVTYMDITQ